MHLTICYITNRKDPMIEWFFDSLHRETGGNYDGTKIVVIDYWTQVVGEWTEANVEERKKTVASKAYCQITHVPPKPTVWQGKYRLTKINYFAASNARNTGLCLAPDGYIVYVDDISVLMPGWLKQVREASEAGWIACGSFRKVLRLEVEKGEVKSFFDHMPGLDRRFHGVPGDEPRKTGGSHMYGSSVALPVEALLKINGFDEDCDSMSGEDYIAGIMLERNGFELYYCRRMMTFESEERHFIDPPMSRIIKPKPGYADASHVILDWVRNGRRIMAPNYQNMRETRAKVLVGEPFPIIQCPAHHWVDGQPLCEMDQTR